MDALSKESKVARSAKSLTSCGGRDWAKGKKYISCSMYNIAASRFFFTVSSGCARVSQCTCGWLNP